MIKKNKCYTFFLSLIAKMVVATGACVAAITTGGAAVPIISSVAATGTAAGAGLGAAVGGTAAAGVGGSSAGFGNIWYS